MSVPYMLIGGMANAIWGVPRSTIDVDVAVVVADLDIPSMIAKLGQTMRIVPADPVDFVRNLRVLPLDSAEGVRIDVIFGQTPLEEEAIRRAVSRRIGERDIRVCTAEDLILFKICSEREKDSADAEGIVKQNAKTLDRRYLDPRVETLSRGLDRPDILDDYLSWFTDRGVF